MNPRCTFAHYSLSRGAPSATWVLLHRTGSSMKLCFPEGKLAEREGFEPPVPFGITGFQDQRHQPLGHLSSTQPAKEIIACFAWHVNHFFLLQVLFLLQSCNTEVEKPCRPNVETKALSRSAHFDRCTGYAPGMYLCLAYWPSLPSIRPAAEAKGGAQLPCGSLP